MKNLYPFKNLNFFVFALLISFHGYAQEEEEEEKNNKNYFQLEFAMPIVPNENWGEEDEDFLRADGAYLRAGFGRSFFNTIHVGLHTGMEWKSSEDLFAVPVYANVKLSPDLFGDEELKPAFSFGYGKVLLLEDRHISGQFIRGSIGVDLMDENENVISVFIELSYYKFKARTDQPNLNSLNIGFAYTFL